MRPLRYRGEAAKTADGGTPGTGARGDRGAGRLHSPLPEDATASSASSARADLGWIARVAAWLGRIGADPEDDEDLRQKKALLILLAVLVLPVSIVWGSLYLGFGSPVGFVPFVYFAVSLGSLALFARLRKFHFLLNTQLIDILL